MKTVRRRKSSYPPTRYGTACSTHIPLPLFPPSVHILQGDLILHKRTLEPIKTVIYGLRRYDVDRAMALRETVEERKKEDGYMSHKSKIYLVSVLRGLICVWAGC